VHLLNLIYAEKVDIEKNFFIDAFTTKLITESVSTFNAFCVYNNKMYITAASKNIIFTFINDIIKEEYNFEEMDEKSINKNNILSVIIKFLRNILIKQYLNSSEESLLEILNIKKILNVLMEIYKRLIFDNKDNLFKEFICFHTDCIEFQCREGRIPKLQYKYIMIGFDLFLILIMLRDIFPYHELLILFDINNKLINDSKLKNKIHKRKRNMKEIKIGNSCLDSLFCCKKKHNNEDSQMYYDLSFEEKITEVSNSNGDTLELNDVIK